MKRLALMDERVFQWIAAHKSNQPEKWIPKTLRVVSRSADGYLYAPLAAMLFYFDNEHGALFVYTAVMAYMFEIPLYLVMKQVFKRPRPCDYLCDLHALVKPADKFSLPSGHTAAAFLMATIVSHFYPSSFAFIMLWACLVGVSRVVLRVHFPLDVIIGASLGISVASVSILILG